MTKIYFVRHAQPKFSHHEDLTRPLTNEGKGDSEKVFKAKERGNYGRYIYIVFVQ